MGVNLTYRAPDIPHWTATAFTGGVYLGAENPSSYIMLRHDGVAVVQLTFAGSQIGNCGIATIKYPHPYKFPYHPDVASGFSLLERVIDHSLYEVSVLLASDRVGGIVERMIKNWPGWVAIWRGRNKRYDSTSPHDIVVWHRYLPDHFSAGSLLACDEPKPRDEIKWTQ